MAGKIFDETLDVNNRIDRNNFDLSEAKHLTTNVGRVTPCYINLLPPNSSLQINPTFALKFMPFAYDLQNKLNARISFFKVPLRTLWSEYKDFVGNYDKSLVPPYIDFGNQQKCERMLSVSSLSDYLGIPPIESGSYTGANFVDYKPKYITTSTVGDSNNSSQSILTTTASPHEVVFGDDVYYNKPSDNVSLSSYGNGKKTLLYRMRYTSPNDIVIKGSKKNYYIEVSTVPFFSMFPDRDKLQLRFAFFDNSYVSLKGRTVELTYVHGDSQSLPYVTLSKDNVNDKILRVYVPDWAIDFGGAFPVLQYYRNLLVLVNSPSVVSVSSNFANKPIRILTNSLVSASSDPNDLPFYTSSSISNRQAKISAYPFRAYESVYNCYYRDMRNNPYYVDGKVQYNKWIPSDNGGADTYEYKLYSANWERDFLTTAQHTPQQGDPNRPPLVGITTYTQSVQNEDGTLTTRENAAIVDETGRKFGLEFDSDEEGLTGVRYTRLADNLSVRSTRSLVDVAESGISIADLRNVNAYQKFLEMNMRKGYSYKDIIEGRFDVKVRYSDLLMPEFIGGVSRDFSTMAVTQMVDNTQDGSGSYKDVLGSQAGLSQVSGATDGISVFCDEECVIIGLLVITPRPVYTQLVPKWFYNRSLLDSFQPEFNHLGYQPIYNREINPYASFRGGSMDDVFGYQRPWYDYVSKVDTACGLYRTQLTDFLMQRKYNGVPNLSVDFLTVKEEDVNNVFTVTDVSDKIFGQIYFDVRAKLPIARIAVPKLD